MRAGTENVYGIVGFAKALEIATANHEEESAYIKSIKYYLVEQLTKQIKGVGFNGDPMGMSNYTVLNVSFPKSEKSEMQGSHVIRAFNNNPNQIPVRFSFCKNNTKEEVDVLVEKLKLLI